MSEEQQFDVRANCITIPTKNGPKPYLPVAKRLVWFRQDHPDWSVTTQFIELNIEAGFAICKATIKDREGYIVSEGTKQECKADFKDFTEKAETGAIGRALAVCGYGTAYAPELDEEQRIVDAPQDWTK